jgi:hypothetical protein
MNPVTTGTVEITSVSEPSKVGIEMNADGGATAPVQKAEQTLQVE